MRFIVEFEGAVVDVRRVHYGRYRDVAAEIGWSRVDEATYWRLVRTKGSDADVLPGARPAKRSAYRTRFAERVEEAETIAQYRAHDAIDRVMVDLVRYGSFDLVTLGANLSARRAWIEGIAWASLVGRMEKLSDDPRRRGAELRALSDGDPRTLVIAADETIIRAAGNAELFSVGVSSGSCTPARLHQAGADIVLTGLAELADSLASGAQDLIRAGLLPASLG